jgi:hypothetical protein
MSQLLGDIFVQPVKAAGIRRWDGTYVVAQFHDLTDFPHKNPSSHSCPHGLEGPIVTLVE